ncbi:MAG TPA: carboxymuconolactone decarboxylase family protein [Steroidobacteraceae bacterium]|nr:carboxymuconolactone decarboxylase family protein [Steroidobacteraceae bacterium]
MALKKTPDAYRRLKLEHADYINAVEALGSAVRQAGPLEEKVTQLVQLGAAAAIRSEGAVHSHARRALEMGATADEIHHALISITSTIGFPNVRAALSWADDVIGKTRSRKRVPRRGMP